MNSDIYLDAAELLFLNKAEGCCRAIAIAQGQNYKTASQYDFETEHHLKMKEYFPWDHDGAVPFWGEYYFGNIEPRILALCFMAEITNDE